MADKDTSLMWVCCPCLHAACGEGHPEIDPIGRRAFGRCDKCEELRPLKGFQIYGCTPEEALAIIGGC